jgi:hypothetical protein
LRIHLLALFKSVYYKTPLKKKQGWPATFNSHEQPRLTGPKMDHAEARSHVVWVACLLRSLVETEEEAKRLRILADLDIETEVRENASPLLERQIDRPRQP